MTTFSLSISEILQILAVSVAVMSLIVSNLLVAKQIRLTNVRMEMDYKLSLRQKALAYSLYSSMHLRDARLRIENNLGEYLRNRHTISMDKLEDVMKKEPHLYSDIMTLLAHWENMALSIYSDVADAAVACNMVAGTLTTHVIVFSDFIKDRRNVNKRAYENLLRLKNEWETQLSPPEVHVEPVIGR